MNSHVNLNIYDGHNITLGNSLLMNLTFRNKLVVNNKMNVMNAKYLAQTNE